MDFKLLQRQSNKNCKVFVQNTKVDQWNKIEDSDVSSHSYSSLVLNKDAKSIQGKKASLVSSVGKLDIHLWKTESRDLSLPSKKCTENESKMLMYDMKLCMYYGKILQDLDTGDDFLNRTLIA
jgi:hypothetical protein